MPGAWKPLERLRAGSPDASAAAASRWTHANLQTPVPAPLASALVRVTGSAARPRPHEEDPARDGYRGRIRTTILTDSRLSRRETRLCLCYGLTVHYFFRLALWRRVELPQEVPRRSAMLLAEPCISVINPGVDTHCYV